MKILMIGRGVISTQYGWVFEQEGHIVQFYIRPEKIAKLKEEVALNIYDSRKKIDGVLIDETWKTRLTEKLNAEYDLIFVSVQHYQLKNVINLLEGSIGDATLLIFNNLWAEPQQLVANFPVQQVVWGFPMAGGGFDETGTLNGSLLGGVNIGSIGKVDKDRKQNIIGFFRASGFKVKEVADFRSYLFAHFIINAALHSENLKANRGMSSSIKAMQTTRFWQNVKLNGQELIPILLARNVDIVSSKELKLFSLPSWLLSFFIRIAVKFLPPIKQIFAAHSNPDEIKSYGEEVLATARQLKISLPRLESAYESTSL
jgi:2-dehydropantoate 2-reductase